LLDPLLHIFRLNLAYPFRSEVFSSYDCYCASKNIELTYKWQWHPYVYQRTSVRLQILGAGDDRIAALKKEILKYDLRKIAKVVIFSTIISTNLQPFSKFQGDTNKISNQISPQKVFGLLLQNKV